MSVVELPTPTAVVADGCLSIMLRGRRYELHPLWLRSRSMAAGDVDPVNFQRLVEPTDIAPDLRVREVREGVPGATDGTGTVIVRFSDGHEASFERSALAIACGAAPDPEAKPAARPWSARDISIPIVEWAHLDQDGGMAAALQAFYELGCFVLRGTPRAPGSLHAIAGRFGRVAPTSFGDLFDVRAKPDPDDLAYTSVALSAHVDQPYRSPMPGLQFLHALVNDAPGGDSTVCDGLSAVEGLRRADPEAFDALRHLPVEFRYDIGSDVKVGVGPVIELDAAGALRRLRFSPRLDFAPAVDPAVLDVWYRGRRLLAEHLNHPDHQATFRLEAGDCLVVDNHRVLHGRTSFDAGAGERHLQGCYIDHDGPDTAWRLLVRSGGAASGPASPTP